MSYVRKNYTQAAIAILVVFNLSLLLVWASGREVPPSTKAGTSFPELEYLTANNNLSFSQLSDYFTKLADDKGAEYAFDVLKIAPMPPNTDMHLLGHVVGDILFKQKNIEGIQTCTQDFRNACSHSIVVGLLLEQGEGVLSEIADVCKKAPGGSGAYTMCFHGLGHGVLAYAGYDIPKSIDLCKKTGTKEYGDREAIECIGGGIMEIVGGGFHDKELWEKQSKKYLDTSNPVFPCSADFMPENARAQCYLYITPHLFKSAGLDVGNPSPAGFGKAFKYCDLIPASQVGNRDACYGGFGKEFVGLTKARDIRNIGDMTEEELSRVDAWCDTAESDVAKKSCNGSALASIYWGGENNRSGAIKFCSIIKNKSMSADCFNRLIDAVAFYITDKSYRKAFCGEIPEEKQAVCREKLI